MPDQRMHDLWINCECACGHESCEVHDIASSTVRAYPYWTPIRRQRSLPVIRHRAANVPICRLADHELRWRSQAHSVSTMGAVAAAIMREEHLAWAEQTSASRVTWRPHNQSSSNVQSG